MTKKRTSLEAIGLSENTATDSFPIPAQKPKAQSGRPGIKQQTAYLPEPVHNQLRHLAFDENRKMHDLLMEGLDRVFKSRGLKSIAELTGKQ